MAYAEISGESIAVDACGNVMAKKEMGVTAFVRSNKGVVVTREGEELLSYS